MGPDRTLSRISKLLDKMADYIEKDGFQDTEKLKQFNCLLTEYRNLAKILSPAPGRGLSDDESRRRDGTYPEIYDILMGSPDQEMPGSPPDPANKQTSKKRAKATGHNRGDNS